MPRPKLHSDAEVLAAALGVILSRGPSAFTLTDVANAIGMSRAALIQRFGDKAGLHRRVMEMMTADVRDYMAALPPDTGLGPMWAMLRDLISGMGAGDGTEGYLLLYWEDVRDPALLALARERNELVRLAIRDRLPAEPHDVDMAAGLIQGHCRAPACSGSSPATAISPIS